MSKSDNERQPRTKAENILDQDKRRRERQMRRALRSADIDEDWDSIDYDLRESRRHKQQLH